MSGVTRGPAPDLSGRKAQCVCGRTTPSSIGLASFEYRGPASRWATDVCVCGYHRLAHHEDVRKAAVSPTLRNCPGFRARGQAPFDAYWCGCEQNGSLAVQAEQA